MVSKIHTKNWFNFAFLKRHLGRSWGPFGADSGRFGQIPADSGGSFLNVRIVFSPRPPLCGPNMPPKCPQRPSKTSEKLPRTSYHDPTKFRWIKFPRSGFLFLQIWRRSSGALCLLHAPCAITIANSKKNISATNLKVDLFLGAAVSRERLQ